MMPYHPLRFVLSTILALAGVVHLVNPALFLPAMPPWIPWHEPLILLTGILEIAAAVGLWIKPLARLGRLVPRRLLHRHPARSLPRRSKWHPHVRYQLTPSALGPPRLPVRLHLRRLPPGTGSPSMTTTTSTINPEHSQISLPRSGRPWMRWWLLAAAAYNLLFGAWVIAFPNALFNWAGMAPPTYPEIWQCVGMIVGVYGIGYAIASADPLRHWPIILVGFLGKIFGPLGFAQALYLERLPLKFGAILLTNDLLWWLPFGLILWHAWRSRSTTHYKNP